ncbi:MAG: deoxynucleoside kinase [Pseudomonadales bacterium]|nr:deoxynucleoside kinase [Gammaproteobacteria bacterium]MBP6053591.1 deoxynucleoside kinase [Pseudomonadales bacterium]MBK6581390.1 deoxynucleoside kinase [Gammaproteobacteria bacterium]MBK7167799.1 deoxynucleoside kinase [Gammaproteobacteria bacterium]MBK7518660.1 deoxynucleoside kinase [Gammaproteobacteria bacterium]
MASRNDTDSREPLRYIAVEGPIGAGKTTLARKLAYSFGHEPLLERAGENPFLEEFYRHRARNALATQMHFLIERVRQLDAVRQADMFQPARVADFLIEKDRLFARLNLDANEYALYETIYERLVSSTLRPDLVIYLQAPVDVLIDRVRQRGIAFEQLLERKYLEQLNEAYSQFFHFYDDAPLLIVNAAAIDFANDENHYTELVDYLLNVRSGRQYFNPTFF